MKTDTSVVGKNKELHRRTLIADELSIVLAFFSAIVIRYDAIVKWVDYNSGIYVSMFVTVIVFQFLIYFVYDMKCPVIVTMDPVDNFLMLFKSRALLAVFSLSYLYITQRSVLASRIVFGIFILLSVIYGYIFRMTICHWAKKNDYYTDINEVYILVVDDSGNYSIEDIVKKKYSSVLILSESGSQSNVETLIQELEAAGVRTYLSLDCYGYRVRTGIVNEVGGYAAIPCFVRKDRFNLFGIHYCISKIEEAVQHVIRHLDILKGEYICFSNVHTSVMARENKDYENVLNSAALVFPDGNPIAKIQKSNGYLDAERVAGPDFMRNMFRNTQDGKISHYFYGSTEETLMALKENLVKEYPGINIKGFYSPPFRELTPEEDMEDIRRINESGADILWVGLGAPKQEKWMNAHKGKISAVMMGVGAGFDFHAGTIDRAPVWIQKIGFEWLYRLFQDPSRLFKRYFITNIKFFWYLFISKKQ